MKVGILDWGIGGVDLMLRIRNISKADFTYFSDTGYTPYGKVSKEELKNRVENVIDFLKNEGCDFIFVGCNAASTVIEENENIKGVIQAGIKEVHRYSPKQIGLVGGVRTVESEIYKKSLENNGIQVKQVIAQPLSALIEKGILEGEELEFNIKTIFSPLQNETHILLACTHYIKIESAIKSFLPHVQLIDPIDFFVEEISDTFKELDGESKIEFFTTGSKDEMKYSLKRIYQLEIEYIKKVSL